MRASRALSIALCLTLALGNGACLQVVAWAGMLAARTAEQGLSAAVDTTFSGKRPCALCRVAAVLEEQHAADVPPAAAKKSVKADLAVPLVAVEVVGCSGPHALPRLVDRHPPAMPLAAPEPPPPRRA